MTRMDARAWALCVLAPVLAGCATLGEGARGRDVLFQTSTYAALADGLYDGDLTVGALKRHGDFGHGTFNGLDGEMIVLGGVVYQARPGGMVSVAPDDTLTPFAAVTPFEAEATFRLNGSGEGRATGGSAGRDARATGELGTRAIENLNGNAAGRDAHATEMGARDYAALQSQLDRIIPDANRPYAIRITGNFSALKLRAPHKAEPPYPPLTEALATQVIRDYDNIEGTMVGFYFPRHMAGLQFPGYHFHFISADRRTGGHVLAVSPAAVTVAIDDIRALQFDGL